MAKQQVAEKSSGMVHVYSTLACPQMFVTYAPPPETGMLPVEQHKVLIKGGAGIANKNLITAMGVHTAISQEDYDQISKLAHFQKFVDSGHITVERKQAYDIEKIVSNMNPRDPGGPITPADFAASPVDGTAPLPVELEKAGTGWVANQLTNR